MGFECFQLVYWSIGLLHDILQITILYHVVDEPPWVTAAAGSLANLEVIPVQQPFSCRHIQPPTFKPSPPTNLNMALAHLFITRAEVTTLVIV